METLVNQLLTTPATQNVMVTYDLTLIERAKLGNQKAFTELWNRYYEPLKYRTNKLVGNTIDAEDLVMESFSKAFNKIEQYSAEYAFSTWLYKIANNVAVDFLRKKKLDIDPIYLTNNGGEEILNSVAIEDEALNPEDEFVNDQAIEDIKSAIKLLSPKHRMMLELFYIEERTPEEVAEQLDMPLDKLKGQLLKAKEKLKHLLVMVS